MGTQALKIDRTDIKNWWSQAGTNRRPLACHASALPAELWPHRRRGTLPDGDQFVKKMNELRAPNRLCAVQSSQRLDFTQNSQGGVDGRRHRPSADGEANWLGKLAERDALCRREPGNDLVNGRRRPIN